LNVTQVKFGLVAERVSQLGKRRSDFPIDQKTAFPVKA